MLVAVAFTVCLAQCPIQVDQLPTTPDGLSGTSVAIEGDLAVIGCPIGTGNGWASGMVIVYRLVNNVWQREAELIAKDGAVGDMMGVSVDVSEGRIIAGAWFNNHAGTNSGAAYIFEQVNGLWVQTTKLIAKDAYTQDSFGRRVAIEGAVCVVTAPLDDDNGASSGSAYVYQFDNTWFQLQKLTAKGGTGGDQFGLGLAMDGERILIGSPFANEGRGNAYLFDRANVMFVESEVFSDPNGEPADNFSFSMDVDGDNVAIGSYLDDDVAPDAGSVFMFAPGIDGWDLSQHIVPTNGFSTDEQFGVSIAMHGSVMLVGSRFALIDGLQAGEVNVFDSVNSYWNKRSSIISPEPTIGAEFGWSVAIDGDYGIAGAPWLEPDGEVQFYNGFITSCECLGDVDGDGSVGVTDLLQLIGVWGVCANCDEDLNGNGVVEVSDILELISFWGTCQ